MHVSDWQQVVLRSEPAAGVDHDVVRVAGVGVEDEAVHVAELLTGWVLDLEVVELDRRVVEIACLDVPQPRSGMTHRGPPAPSGSKIHAPEPDEPRFKFFGVAFRPVRAPAL